MLIVFQQSNFDDVYNKQIHLVIGGKIAYLTYAEYIMWNAELDGSQAGIKITRRNMINLRWWQTMPP